MDETVTTTDQPAPGPAVRPRTVQEVLEVVSDDLVEMEAALDRVIAPPAGYIGALVDHVRGFGGKRLRPSLVILAGRVVDASKVGADHYHVGAIVELIHTATLVHDDILDGALLRRKRPTLHTEEGIEVSVLLGDFLLARAFADAAGLEDRTASQYLSHITGVVCQGEILQIHNRGNLDLSEESYQEIIEKKTGVLYAGSCKMGARYAGGTEEQLQALYDYGLGLGAAFQVVDDVLDLTGDEAVVGKSLGTDLSRCKLTLPLIHFMREGEPSMVARVRESLSEGRGGEDAGMIRDALHEAGSVDFARRRARQYVTEAAERLEMFDPSPARDALRDIAQFVLERRR